MMGMFFYLCKVCKILRVPVEVELAGLDISKHGGSAYEGGSAYDGGEAGKVRGAMQSCAECSHGQGTVVPQHRREHR